ncbi:MAG TPA: TIGR01777 family oxidoreductase [Parafilimonas sp.]|nr:TIGR01777 family oxidoreductase [Parafilimonas sp.]
MEKKVVIAGGTGFIGQYLAKKFSENGYSVVIVSRDKNHVNWNDENALAKAMEHAAILINLAGKSVNCRYNEKNKKEILLSRTETTEALGRVFLNCNNPPELWINASTATIYRHAEDRPMTEAAGAIGKGFSVDVATNWERSFFSFKLRATRQIALRIAIVLGEGGVMKPFINLVRFGLGGNQGNGNQMFSWIHIEDLYRIIVFLQSHKEITGVLNCAAPNPVKNKTLMKTLRQNLNVHFGLPAPAWLLAIGAVIIRTETELILKSRWVIPEKLLQAGYSFKYPSLDVALKNILHNT